MKSSLTARLLLGQLLESDQIVMHQNFPKNNQQYLEAQIAKLEAIADHHHSISVSLSHPARVRARSRDMEQSCTGLINGIKFGISFMLGLDRDLAEEDRKAEADGLV